MLLSWISPETGELRKEWMNARPLLVELFWPHPTPIFLKEKIMDKTNRNQWIAITILGLAFLCLLTLFVLNPTKPQSPIELLPLFPETSSLTPEANNTAIAPANTEVALSLPEVPSTTPTNTPMALATEMNNQVIWLIGGRLDEAGNGYEYVATADLSYIENGTPLQPYFSQVVDVNFSNTLNLSNTHEILNDGVQFVIVGDKAYIMPREDTAKVPFWSISWIQYDAEKGILICVDDAGAPGDWFGACAGETMWVTTSIPLSQLLVSDLFSPWAKEFVNVQSVCDGTVMNDKIEVIVTFRR